MSVGRKRVGSQYKGRLVALAKVSVYENVSYLYMESLRSKAIVNEHNSPEVFSEPVASRL
jgi:hypothetical protein